MRENKGTMENRKNGKWNYNLKAGVERIVRRGMKKEPGIDGILVTVGLCIIALLLCVVMRKSMTGFIETIITSLTSEAQKLLGGITGGVIL